DEQGQEVEFSVAKAEEQIAYRARYGKLDPKLHQKLEDLSNEQSFKDPRLHRKAGDGGSQTDFKDPRIHFLKLGFWLTTTEDLNTQDLRTGLTREEVDELLTRRLAQVKAATARATEGLTRTLEQAGYDVVGRSEVAPVVFATLPADVVVQFSLRDDVEL